MAVGRESGMMLIVNHTVTRAGVLVSSYFILVVVKFD